MQSFKLLINRREFIHQLFITRLVMFLGNFDIFYLHSCQFFYHHSPIITPGSTVVACTKLFPAQKVFLHISQYEFFFWLVKGFANLHLVYPGWFEAIIGVKVSRKRHWFALDSVEFCALGHPEPILGLLCLKILQSGHQHIFFC